MNGGATRRTPVLAALLTMAMVASILATGPLTPGAGAAITQPSQPRTGPGGSDYTNGFRETAGGSGSDAWYVFEPTGPKPTKAPVAIIMHGYYEFSGHQMMQGLIEHTVKKGSIVIYPRWQTGVATPCPGPLNIEPCMDSAVKGIKDALAYLRSSRANVQPITSEASYLGFSFGGILTANLANRYRALNLPKPRAIFLEDPHDGGILSNQEPGLDETLDGIPSAALVQCHASGEGVTSEAGKAASGCNNLFPKLTSVPAKNKDLVLTSADDHGEPTLRAPHGVCAGGGTSHLPVDAYDWGFCWKSWDAMRSCAIEGKWCEYAVGDTPRHRYIGTWSDGVPIIGLKIQEEAPIAATPVPARQPEPPVFRPAVRLKLACTARGLKLRLTGKTSSVKSVTFRYGRRAIVDKKHPFVKKISFRKLRGINAVRFRAMVSLSTGDPSFVVTRNATRCVRQKKRLANRIEFG